MTNEIRMKEKRKFLITWEGKCWKISRIVIMATSIFERVEHKHMSGNERIFTVIFFWDLDFSLSFFMVCLRNPCMNLRKVFFKGN